MSSAQTSERFTLRWDDSMGCYRVNVPNLEGPIEVVAAAEYDRARRNHRQAEAEMIALADAFRATLEGQGMARGTAALMVQGIIDQARANAS